MSQKLREREREETERKENESPRYFLRYWTDFEVKGFIHITVTNGALLTLRVISSEHPFGDTDAEQLSVKNRRKKNDQSFAIRFDNCTVQRTPRSKSRSYIKCVVAILIVTIIIRLAVSRDCTGSPITQRAYEHSKTFAVLYPSYIYIYIGHRNDAQIESTTNYYRQFTFYVYLYWEV